MKWEQAELYTKQASGGIIVLIADDLHVDTTPKITFTSGEIATFDTE